MKTEQEAKKIAEELLKKIEVLKKEAQARNERFEALTEEQLVNKITGKTSNSPYFYSISTTNASPGGTITCTAYVHNPDPTDYLDGVLFGYMFFGPANFIAGSNAAIVAVDERFPHYYLKCIVAANADINMKFTIKIPTTINAGVYIINCFLVNRSSFDVGKYLDRASIETTVL